VKNVTAAKSATDRAAVVCALVIQVGLLAGSQADGKFSAPVRAYSCTPAPGQAAPAGWSIADPARVTGLPTITGLADSELELAINSAVEREVSTRARELWDDIASVGAKPQLHFKAAVHRCDSRAFSTSIEITVGSDKMVHPRLDAVTINIDTTDGRWIRLRDVLPDGNPEAIEDAIDDALREVGAGAFETPARPYPEEFYQDFVLAHDSVMFIIEPCTITACAAWTLYAHVSYSKVPDRYGPA
jgi:hypothetical protein